MTRTMNRLQAEHHRLFHLEPSAQAAGWVRAPVLGISGPADWPVLAAVWRGVQADWQWPAPAIAVNGTDAFELRFPLADPVPADEATTFLVALCQRYLADLAPARLRLWPSPEPGLAAEPAPIPQQQPATGRWSAFVAPDLAAVFGDDPSLDIPPGDDAQADLLSRIRPASAGDWRRALAQVAPAVPTLLPATAEAAQPPQVLAQAVDQPPRHDDPRRFLLDVMNDPTVDMALRIEAAKALVR